MSVTRSIIGVKRMGILDEKAFLAACKKKAANDVSKKAENYDLGGESILLLTKWEHEITQPDWHPFKVIDVNGHAKVNLILLVLLLLGEQHILLDRVFGSPLMCVCNTIFMRICQPWLNFHKCMCYLRISTGWILHC
jgi:hypothetical protein